METNEYLQTALRQEAEVEVLKLVESLPTLKEGDLKGVETHVLERIMSVGRKWMECILSHESPCEPPPVRREGACGHEQHLVGVRPKQLLTMLGKVTFCRPYYQCVRSEQAEAAGNKQECSHGEAPADAIWGVQARRTSAGVQQAISYLCASLTLEEAAETFSRLLPLGMSARQALNLMQPVGEGLACAEEKQVAALWEQAPRARSELTVAAPPKQEDIERLYIELDGVTARMRRGSVPMEDKELKRAGDVYREVKVGAVFAASRGRQRSALAPGVFVDYAGKKHYVARRCKAEDFGKALYTLAVMYGLPQARQVVVVGDGALWIWGLAADHFAGAVQIVDLWHAREHVWKVARAVFASGSLEAAAWAEHACTLLVKGQIEDLVAEIAALPAVPPEPAASRSVPEIEMDYFISNAARMRYPAFRAQGMQVGSGIAEAACKTVVSTRAKRSGMRWTPAGLDAVLALRTAVLNATYDDFWEHQYGLVA